MKKPLAMTLAGVLIFILVSFTGCDEPKDKTDDGIVPQVNIDWPSLGDTPWPMFQHDPQHTGRSQYAGPSQGSIYKKVDMVLSFGSVVVGFNSSIYIGGYREFDCFDYDGILKWKCEGAVTDATPLITVDSLVMIPSGINFVAFNSSGSTNWSTPINVVWGLGSNIDKEGNLYFVDNTPMLNVLNHIGELQWQLADSRILNGSDIAPVISPDGNTVYLQGYSVSILAVDILTHSVKWTFGTKPLLSSPAVDNAGNLYFTPGDLSAVNMDSSKTIYSINESGDINWQYNIGTSTVYDNTEATIDYDGNIFFAYDTLYSFQNNGKLRWKIELSENMCSVASLICDANNTVYVCTGTRNGMTRNNELLAIDQDGTLLWRLKDTEERIFGPSPALTEDGTLIYPTWNNYPGKLILIK